VDTIALQSAVEDLYRKARLEGAPTSTRRLDVLANLCVRELARRGLAGAETNPCIPGFAREKNWDVVWSHRGKARLAISLKSLLANLSGTVPNRLDDLIGETANLQMHSPEIVIGYIMVFNVENDEMSRKHGRTWGELLRERLSSISDRRAPHWTVGTVEASAFVEVDFATGPHLLSGEKEVVRMFDVLVAQVRARNPDLRSPGD
jgi:hypothetical protein